MRSLKLDAVDVYLSSANQVEVTQMPQAASQQPTDRKALATDKINLLLANQCLLSNLRRPVCHNVLNILFCLRSLGVRSCAVSGGRPLHLLVHAQCLLKFAAQIAVSQSCTLMQSSLCWGLSHIEFMFRKQTP